MSWYQHFGASQLPGELQSNAVQPAQSDLWETSTGLGLSKNCKEMICMNLCNNTAEVKDANLGQQRAHIHFSDLFQ